MSAPRSSSASSPVSGAVFCGALAPGRGSNLEALIQAQQQGEFARARIAVVISNRPKARALEVARTAGIPAFAVVPGQFATAGDYEEEILRLLRDHGCEWVILAGYMKIVGPTLLGAFADRMVNIHPSLLPSFPGLHAQRQAVEYGVRFSGCTVHFVDEGVDSGPIISQRVVPVLPGDDEGTLAARILAQEHQLFPAALKLLTERRWELRHRTFTLLDE